MKRSIIQVQAFQDGDHYFVASCSDLHAVTQGKTLDELAYNIREVIELAMDGEDMSELGYVDHPSVLVSLELPLAHA